MSAPSTQTIHSQDDFELLHHIEASWQSIQETVRELNRRGKVVDMLQEHNRHDPRTFILAPTSWRMWP